MNALLALPPGVRYAECVRAIVARLRALGLPHEVIPFRAPRAARDTSGAAVVLSHVGTGRRTLYFSGHYDVVPETTPGQCAPVVRGKTLFGRGTCDMKGGLAAMLYAAVALQRVGAPLDGRVGLVFVPDEEIGGDLGAKWMRANHYAELDPEYVIDEGGFGSRDMLTPGKLVFGISVAEKRIMWLRLRAEGVAGHGSQPHDKNPNEHLMAALGRLFAQPPAAAPFPACRRCASPARRCRRGCARGCLRHGDRAACRGTSTAARRSRA